MTIETGTVWKTRYSRIYVYDIDGMNNIFFIWLKGPNIPTGTAGWLSPAGFMKASLEKVK